MGIFKAFKRNRSTGAPRAPDQYRAYAVGDIHGRLDLLDHILAKIEKDVGARDPDKTLVVFLGDVIDRGPCSREVVERLRTLSDRLFKPIFLMGNHEEVLLRLIGGEPGLMASWLRFGGSECAVSYGLDLDKLHHLPEADALAALRAAVPDDHVRFLQSFSDTFRFGDYLFVHAGIRPGVEISSQSQRDLRWIRAAFLDDPTDHGFLVVHGHTVTEMVDERDNRIGLDTGAYATGTLTALAVEGKERWYLSTDATASEQTTPLVD